MNKWIASGIVMTQIVIAHNVYASEAKCPVQFEPFTEEQCKTYENLQEAVKKKQEKANKCHKEGAGEVKGAKNIDEDNNANHKTVTEETTKNLKNCTQCFTDIENNITEECAEFGQDRQVTQFIRIDAEQKHSKTRQLQMAHVTASKSANKARKDAGFREETRSDNRAHERIEQARIMSDTNAITETGVGNVTTLKREGERVDSSVMTAYKFFHWLKRFSIFG